MKGGFSLKLIETGKVPAAIGPYSQGWVAAGLVFNEVYARYFTGKPARSCVAVRELPKGLLCEIEAIAELDR